MFKIGDRAIEIHGIEGYNTGTIESTEGGFTYNVLFRLDKTGMVTSFTSEGYRYTERPDFSRLYPLTKLHCHLLGVDIETQD